MRRRILTAMLLAVAVALVGFGVPLALTVAGRDRDQALVELSAEAANAAVSVPGSFAREHDLPELPDPGHDIDLALYDTSGSRVAGEGPAEADSLVADVLAAGAARRDRGALVVGIPVTDEEVVVGAIRTSYPASAVAARTRRTWLAMAGLAVVGFAATAVLAVQRSRGLAAPLRKLRDDAEGLGHSTGPESRPLSGIDEIDTVATALGLASARVDDALARERALSADVAHQLRTPLASLRLRLENEQGLPDHDRGLVDDALRDVDRLEATIDELIQLARDVAPSGEPHPLATILREATEPWRQRLAADGRALRVDLGPQLPWVTARPQAVRQIVDILLDNARTHGAGTVTVGAQRRGSGAVVAVSDGGSSILDPDRVFQRRSDARAGTGTGIGLALARRLAEAEGLRLVLAHPGPGPRFHLAVGGRSAASEEIAGR